MSEAKKRDVAVTLEAIADVVPKDNAEAHRMFNWMRQTWPYRPPEFDDQCWRELTKVVNEECVPAQRLDEEWKIKVVALLMGETEEFIREKFKDLITPAA